MTRSKEEFSRCVSRVRRAVMMNLSTLAKRFWTSSAFHLSSCVHFVVSRFMPSGPSVLSTMIQPSRNQSFAGGTGRTLTGIGRDPPCRLFRVPARFDRPDVFEILEVRPRPPVKHVPDRDQVALREVPPAA